MRAFRAQVLRSIPVAIVAAAAIGLLAGGSLTGAASPAPRLAFTVISQDSEATLAPEGFFASPTLAGSGIEDAPVYRDGKKVGSAETVVTITRVDGGDIVGIIECSVELPEGNVFFDGSMHLAQVASGVEIPVVGGTGAYAGVIGVVMMTASADGASTTLAFDLDQPGPAR